MICETFLILLPIDTKRRFPASLTDDPLNCCSGGYDICIESRFGNNPMILTNATTEKSLQEINNRVNCIAK